MRNAQPGRENQRRSVGCVFEPHRNLARVSEKLMLLVLGLIERVRKLNGKGLADYGKRRFHSTAPVGTRLEGAYFVLAIQHVGRRNEQQGKQCRKPVLCGTLR